MPGSQEQRLLSTVETVFVSRLNAAGCSRVSTSLQANFCNVGVPPAPTTHAESSFKGGAMQPVKRRMADVKYRGSAAEIIARC